MKLTDGLYPASRGRLLALVSDRSVDTLLAQQAGRPIAALLTSHGPVVEPLKLEAAILSLLDAGCAWFVCFGETSGILHDRVDDLIILRAFPDDSALVVRTASNDSVHVMTSWLDDESAADVAEFFFNIAGQEEGSLLVAVLGNEDAELADLLVRQAWA